MARSRDIRPEFFTDEKIGELPYGARILFAAIWCHSDCRGVFEHNPKKLRVLAFPYDEGLASQQVAEWLATLEALGMVVRFEAQRRTWGAVKNWRRHQAVNRSEVEIWTDRPEPPDWTNPPAWDAWIQAGFNNGRRRKRGMPLDNVPESTPDLSTESSLGPSQESTPGPSKGRHSDYPQDRQREHAPSPSPSPSKSNAGGGRIFTRTTPPPPTPEENSFDPIRQVLASRGMKTPADAVPEWVALLQGPIIGFTSDDREAMASVLESLLAKAASIPGTQINFAKDLAPLAAQWAQQRADREARKSQKAPAPAPPEPTPEDHRARRRAGQWNAVELDQVRQGRWHVLLDGSLVTRPALGVVDVMEIPGGAAGAEPMDVTTGVVVENE